MKRFLLGWIAGIATAVLIEIVVVESDGIRFYLWPQAQPDPDWNWR